MSLLIHQLARAASIAQAVPVSFLHGYMLTVLADSKPTLVTGSDGHLDLKHGRPVFRLPNWRTAQHYFLSQRHESIVIAPLVPALPPVSMPPSQVTRQGTPTSNGHETSDKSVVDDSKEISEEEFPRVLISVRLESQGI
jgi:hypothetical protein